MEDLSLSLQSLILKLVKSNQTLLIEFELWMGSCRNRLLCRLAGESSLAFCFLHLLFTYCNILFLHLLPYPFSLFQTEELEAADMRLLPWGLVWCLQTMAGETEESQEWYGGDKGADGWSRVVSACPAEQLPTVRGIRSLLFQVLRTRIFFSTALYTTKLYSLCGEE